MAAQNVPSIDVGAQLVEPCTGCLTDYGYSILNSLLKRTGGSVDKVDAAHVLAGAAVPQGTEVISSGGLQIGGALGGNIGVALYAAVDAAASLPTTKLNEGDWAYALDGLKSGESSGSGTGTPCWFSGGAWFAVWSGLAVAT